MRPPGHRARFLRRRARLGGWHSPVRVVVALLAVIAAWLWVAFGSYKSQARPAKTTLLVMLAATAMLGLALLWPRLEPHVTAFLLA